MKSSAFILFVPYVLGSWLPFGGRGRRTDQQPEQSVTITNDETSMSVDYDDSIEKTSSTPRSRSSYFYSGGSLNPLNWWYGSVPEQEDEDSSFEGYPAMFLSTSSSSSSSAQASGQSSDDTEKLNLDSSDFYHIGELFNESSTASNSSSISDDIQDLSSEEDLRGILSEDSTKSTDSIGSYFDRR